MALLAGPLALSTDGIITDCPDGMVSPLMADILLLSDLGILSFDSFVPVPGIACPPILTSLEYLPTFSELIALPTLTSTNTLPNMDTSLEYLPTLEDGC